MLIILAFKRLSYPVLHQQSKCFVHKYFIDHADYTRRIDILFLTSLDLVTCIQTEIPFCWDFFLRLQWHLELNACSSSCVAAVSYIVSALITFPWFLLTKWAYELLHFVVSSSTWSLFSHCSHCAFALCMFTCFSYSCEGGGGCLLCHTHVRSTPWGLSSPSYQFVIDVLDLDCCGACVPSIAICHCRSTIISFVGKAGLD